MLLDRAFSISRAIGWRASENSDILVQKTLRALQAKGSELVSPDCPMADALRFRAGYTEDIKVLPLESVLTFGKIRPVTREIAKRLLNISASNSLQRIVDARMEDQWELWDMLNLLYAGGYDVTHLWKASPGITKASVGWCRRRSFGLYSIASAMDDTAGGAENSHLIVAGLEYQTPHTPLFLCASASRHRYLLLARVTSDPKFRREAAFADHGSSAAFPAAC